MSNELALEMTQYGCKKRIINELIKLQDMGAYVHVDYLPDTKPCGISVNVVLKEEDILFTFVVTNEYPFKPPDKIYLNNKDYKKYLLIESPKTLKEIQFYYGINCLCCNTISCYANWSPSVKLSNFIDEYKNFKKYRIQIIYYLLVPKIIKQYLISDINILQWLV